MLQLHSAWQVSPHGGRRRPFTCDRNFNDNPRIVVTAASRWFRTVDAVRSAKQRDVARQSIFQMPQQRTRKEMKGNSHAPEEGDKIDISRHSRSDYSEKHATHGDIVQERSSQFAQFVSRSLARVLNEHPTESPCLAVQYNITTRPTPYRSAAHVIVLILRGGRATVARSNRNGSRSMRSPASLAIAADTNAWLPEIAGSPSPKVVGNGRINPRRPTG